MPTKKIEEILDNLGEQIEMSNDISDLLSTSIPTTDLLINDIEIENELNKEIINLPNAHSGSIKIPKSSINKQLEELQRLTTG
jgi:galactitol-specific phosphotransferase system IIB component